MKIKADLYIHIFHSNKTQALRWGKVIGKYLIDSKTTVDGVLKSAKVNGIDVISITDHDQIDGTLEAVEKAPKYGIIAIPGLEVTRSDGHIYAYGITKVVEPNQSAEDAIADIHVQGGIAVIAHPFSPERFIFRKSVDEASQRIQNYQFDAVEVSIAFKGKQCDKSTELAEKEGLLMLSSSDSKIADTIGIAHTEIEVEECTADAVISAMKQGKTTVHAFNRNPYAYAFKVLKKNYIG